MIGIEIKIDKKQIAKAILTDKTCRNCAFPMQLRFETMLDAEKMISNSGCRLKILNTEGHDLAIIAPLVRTCEKFVKR